MELPDRSGLLGLSAAPAANAASLLPSALPSYPTTLCLENIRKKPARIAAVTGTAWLDGNKHFVPMQGAKGQAFLHSHLQLPHCLLGRGFLCRRARATSLLSSLPQLPCSGQGWAISRGPFQVLGGSHLLVNLVKSELTPWVSSKVVLLNDHDENELTASEGGRISRCSMTYPRLNSSDPVLILPPAGCQLDLWQMHVHLWPLSPPLAVRRK